MIQIDDINLYVGALDGFYHLESQEDWAFVHLTRVVYFHLLEQWKEEGIVDEESPLIIEHENRMAVDWPDGPADVYKRGGVKAFERIFDFIDRWRRESKVLVHCDEGRSRSPTLTMVYLAKRTDILDDGFSQAKEEFIKLYPHLLSGGMEEFVKENWKEIS